MHPSRTGEPPLLDADAIAAQLPQVDVIFDAGTPPLAQSSAVVRCVGPELEVMREGTLRRDDLLAAAAATLLFVCTGCSGSKARDQIGKRSIFRENFCRGEH